MSPYKNSNLNRNKKIKMLSHICLEEKKNETVGLSPKFLAQWIIWDK